MNKYTTQGCSPVSTSYTTISSWKPTAKSGSTACAEMVASELDTAAHAAPDAPVWIAVTEAAGSGRSAASFHEGP